MIIKFFLTLVALFFCLGCVTLKEEDRHDPPVWASILVQNKASFDFECQANHKPVVRAISYLVFAAKGCGRKAVYQCEDKKPWYLPAEYLCQILGTVSKQE